MKTLPKPGTHVVWKEGPTTITLQPDTDFSPRIHPPTPPPGRGAGIGRLRAAPGAEELRRQVVADQQAALGKVRLERRPIRKGADVRDALGMRGVVIAIEVLVRHGSSPDEIGCVVRWQSGVKEWMKHSALVVLN